jgi:hypothetical protein
MKSPIVQKRPILVELPRNHHGPVPKLILLAVKSELHRDFAQMDLHCLNVPAGGRWLRLPRLLLAGLLEMGELGHGPPRRALRFTLLNMNSEQLGIPREESGAQIAIIIILIFLEARNLKHVFQPVIAGHHCPKLPAKSLLQQSILRRRARKLE